MKTKAITRIQAIALVVALAVVGAGGYFAATLTAPRPLELSIVAPWSGGERDLFQPVLDDFTVRTGINVNYIRQRTEDLAVSLPATFAAKTTVGDVILISSPAPIRQAAEEGHLLALDDVIDPTKYPALFIDGVKVGNNYYGSLVAGSVKPGFWYKKSFFQQNGLTPPKTVAEFRSLLDRIKAIPGIEAPIASGDGVGWPLSDTTEAFIMGIGGPELQRRLINNEVKWTSSEVRGVFDEIVAFLRAGYFSEPADFLTQAEKFWAGKYALYFQGSFIVELINASPSELQDIDFFPFPGTRGATGGVDFAFVPKYTRNPEQAKQLLRFVTGPEGQAIHAKAAASGRIANHKDVSATGLPPFKQTLVDFVKGVEFLPDLDDALGGDYQRAIWDQLKLLWVRPGDLNSVLSFLDQEQAKRLGSS